MKTQKLGIKTQDGVCDSFVAYPDEGRQYPAVLLLMDAFGPRDYLYEMAKTIAARGYYVLLPNLFYRVRPAPVIQTKFPITAETHAAAVQEIMPLFPTLPPELAVRDIGVYFDFMAAQKQVLAGKVAMTGYCLGGSLAIRAAAQYPERIAAAASFHAGNLASDAANSPHLQLNQIKAELYIAHADNDRSMPAEQIKRLKKALEQSDLRYEMEVYEGAVHGFTMADLPAHNEAALERHWEKLFALLERSFSADQ